MGLLQKILGPRNSLVLAYDHISPDFFDEWEIQLEEVGRFYSFVRLSELSQPNKRFRTLGLAAVVFRQPRRSLFTHAVPILRQREIPFTVFVEPDLVGTNRLLDADEISLYEAHFPTQGERQIEKLRAAFGPPPFDKIDPTYLLATWGALMELDLKTHEIGLYVTSSEISLEEKRKFLSNQLKTTPESAFCDEKIALQAQLLRAAGIKSLVTNQPGMVQKRTSSLSLPQFKFEKG